MRRARALALALLGIGALACGSEAPPSEDLPPVVVAAVEAVDLEERIEATGELIARNQALVAAEVGGRITEILRDEGFRVAQGEVILTIDPERRSLEVADVRARLAEAQAALGEAKREVERIRALHGRGVASQARLEQTETELRLARSRRDGAQARFGVAERALEDASVVAPFDGVVALRHVSTGEFVQPGQGLFRLVAMNPIDAEFRLPEADASRVRSGQGVDVRVAPYPEEVFSAVVRFVSPTIDPESHTLLVRAALDNQDGRLRPGLFARVDLGVSQRAGVPMIAEEAVLQRADGKVVFRLGPDLRVQRLLVETGPHRDGRVELRSGVQVGDRVVVRGHYSLVNGVRVEPRTPDGKLATGVAGGPKDEQTALP